MTEIFKGDDTNAFGQNFIKINRPHNSEAYTISKVIFQCGPIQKVYTRPTFPIYVNFTHTESKKLQTISECFLQVFDEHGLRTTCTGSLKFTAKQQVVLDESRRS